MAPLFTDAQKSDLTQQATDSGIDTSAVTPDSFDKTVDPASGQATMFLKLPSGKTFQGNGKAITAQAQTPASNLPAYMNTLTKLADAAQTTTASKSQITDSVGYQTGIYDMKDALNQQRINIYHAIGGDHSDIFNATNPDGSPLSWGEKVALYNNRIAQMSSQLGMIGQMDAMQDARLQAISDYQYGIQQQKAQQIQQQMDVVKTLAGYDQQQQQNALQRMQQEQGERQFESQQEQKDRQFNASQSQQKEEFYANLNKAPTAALEPIHYYTGINGENRSYNPNTNEDKAIEAPAPWMPQGSELMQALASGQYGGKKFFGVYATGDMDGSTRAAMYDSIGKAGIGATLQKYGSPITEDIINSSAQKYGIDPIALTTILAADSGMGTQGIGERNNNLWNVGQSDDKGTTPVDGYATLQDGVDAAAENLAKRQDALSQSMGNGTDAKNVSYPWIDSGKWTEQQLKDYATFGKDAPNVPAKIRTTKWGSEWNEFAKEVSQYGQANGIDPNPNKMAARNQLTKDYASAKKGTTGFSIGAVETAMQHMDEYSTAVQTYNEGGIPALNYLAQKLGYQTGWTAKITLDAIKNTLSSEMRSIYGGISEGELKKWEENIPTTATKDQAEAWKDETMKLVWERLNTLNSTWKQSFGEDNSRISSIADKFWFSIGGKSTDQKSTSSEATSTGTTIDEASRRKSMLGY